MALIERLQSEFTDPVTLDKVSFFLTYNDNNNQITRFRIVNDSSRQFLAQAKDPSQGIDDQELIPPRTELSFNIPPGRFSYQVDGEGKLVMGDLVITSKWYRSR